jgi:hypothetical protein
VGGYGSRKESLRRSRFIARGGQLVVSLQPSVDGSDLASGQVHPDRACP